MQMKRGTMTVTRELLKNEIEKVSDDYLDMLYQIIRVFEWPASKTTPPAGANMPIVIRRPYGLCAGEFTVPADFNDPLSDEILARSIRSYVGLSSLAA